MRFSAPKQADIAKPLSSPFFWLPNHHHLRAPDSVSLLKKKIVHPWWNEVRLPWNKFIPDITQWSCSRCGLMCPYWSHCWSPCTSQLPTTFFRSGFVGSATATKPLEVLEHDYRSEQALLWVWSRPLAAYLFPAFVENLSFFIGLFSTY